MSGSNPACQLFKKVLQPVHNGLPRVPLYDGSEFTKVNICLDSGKLATDACYMDPRHSAVARVENCTVLKDDVPTEKCDKHVVIDFCSSCNCVATQYCRNFAAVGQCTLVKRALLKMTQEEVDAIVLASKHGLNATFKRDDYVYLVDTDGNPVDFYGMDGTKNLGLHEPYVVCTVHTQETWREYTKSNSDQ